MPADKTSKKRPEREARLTAEEIIPTASARIFVKGDTPLISLDVQDTYRVQPYGRTYNPHVLFNERAFLFKLIRFSRFVCVPTSMDRVAQETRSTVDVGQSKVWTPNEQKSGMQQQTSSTSMQGQGMEMGLGVGTSLGSRPSFDRSVMKIDPRFSPAGPFNSLYLASGIHLGMRQFNLPPNQSKQGLHQRPFEIVGYVLSGTATLTLGDPSGTSQLQTIRLKQGDGYCVPMNTLHQWSIESAFQCVEACSPLEYIHDRDQPNAGTTTQTGGRVSGGYI
jgi:quercetin dioxygenase-like cupin family protein